MDTTAMARKFAAMRDASPKTVACVWGSKSFNAVRREYRQEVKYSDYGASLQLDFQIVALKSDIGTTLPANHDAITIDSASYRIMNPVTEDPAGLTVVMDIGHQRG
jgi:hypothetical protein